MTQTLLVPLIALVVVAALLDLRSRRIPNYLTVSGCVFGIGASFGFGGFDGLIHSVLGLLTGMGLILPGFLLRFTGGGDVKLAAAIGSMSGPQGALQIVIVAVATGACVALVTVLVGWFSGRFGSPLPRYANMLRTLVNTGRFSYVRPAAQEAAATRLPLAPMLAFGTIVISLEMLNFSELLG